jgi:hypothetical protein
MKKMIPLLWLALFATCMQAQKAQMLFYGVIEEGVLQDPNGDAASVARKEKSKPLKDVQVHVYLGGELISSNASKESGFYGVLLKSGGNYEVVFEKNGYFSKRYALNCKNLEHPADGSALKCPLDIELFKAVESAELEALSKKHFGICSVNRNDIKWDKEAMHKQKVSFFELAQPMYLQNEK